MIEKVVVRRGKDFFYIDVPGDEKPLLKYRIEGKSMFLESTYTPPMLRGRGYAAKLVEAAIKYAEENDLKIIPICSYVVYYFTKHPNKKNVLDESYQGIIEEQS